MPVPGSGGEVERIAAFPLCGAAHSGCSAKCSGALSTPVPSRLVGTVVVDATVEVEDSMLRERVLQCRSLLADSLRPPPSEKLKQDHSETDVATFDVTVDNTRLADMVDVGETDLDEISTKIIALEVKGYQTCAVAQG
uniref:Uncharacterized protein n=1 Tax=Leersia perrieri TaxID=77586 RepID=A0A0D9VCC5_9ORYZ